MWSVVGSESGSREVTEGRGKPGRRSHGKMENRQIKSLGGEQERQELVVLVCEY